jgi:hypothetical protein
MCVQGCALADIECNREPIYMIGPNHAFNMDENTTPGFGTLQSQSAGLFANASLNGSFFIGTLPTGCAIGAPQLQKI